MYKLVIITVNTLKYLQIKIKPNITQNIVSLYSNILIIEKVNRIEKYHMVHCNNHLSISIFCHFSGDITLIIRFLMILKI